MDDFITIDHDFGNCLAHRVYDPEHRIKLKEEHAAELDRLRSGYESEAEQIAEFEESGRFEEGVQLCESMLDSDPDSHLILYSLGRFYKKLDRPEEAVKVLTKALDLTENSLLRYETESNIFMALKEAAGLKFNEGDIKTGFEWYHKAVEKYVHLTKYDEMLIESVLTNAVNYANLLVRGSCVCINNSRNKEVVEQGIKDLESAKVYYSHIQNMVSKVGNTRSLTGMMKPEDLEHNIREVEKNLGIANRILSTLN